MLIIKKYGIRVVEVNIQNNTNERRCVLLVVNVYMIFSIIEIQFQQMAFDISGFSTIQSHAKKLDACNFFLFSIPFKRLKHTTNVFSTY